MNFDGTPDILCAQGPNGTNRMRVFDGLTRRPMPGLLGNFIPFPRSESNGLFVAAGDIDNDGHADLIVGTEGGTPQTKIFSGATGQLLRTLDLSDLNLTNGVRVAAGDLNGDGKADVIIGSAPGDVSTVAAFDGSNGTKIYEYFPFGQGDRGGVHLAAGLITGDKFADVIVGQATGGSEVRVFSGSTTASAWNLPAFENWTDGVRVGTVDSNRDGRLDVIVGEGPTGGLVRIYAMNGHGEFNQLAPFGSNFNKGVFVAGDPTPGKGIQPRGPRTLPDVWISASSGGIEGGTGAFTLSRSTTGSLLTVFYSFSGTAGMLDFTANFAGITFPAADATVNLDLFLTQDTLYESLESIALTLTSDSAYNLGSPIEATVYIDDDDGPNDFPASSDSGGYLIARNNDLGDPSFFVEGDDDSNDFAFDVETTDDSNDRIFAKAGVRYADGIIGIASCGLASGGMGQFFGISMVWSNGGYKTAYAGNNTMVSELPALETDGADILLLSGGTDAEYFDGSGGSYTPRHYSQNSLTYDAMTGEYTFISSAGSKLVFSDFSTLLPVYQRGAMNSVTDPNGNVTTITSRTTDGKPEDIQRTSTVAGTTTTESFLFAYITSGTNTGKISNVTLRRQVGAGSWTTIRKVEYDYYGTGSSNGTAGDLKTSIVKDGSSTVLDTRFFRYYTASSSIGYAGAMKYAFSADSYARLKTWCDANSTTPDNATDAQVAPFASDYLEFDAFKRVTKHTRQGTGCSACTGGLGTYTFTYSLSAFADGYNSWRTKTVETQPDGNTRTVYTNFAGQVILGVYATTNDEWMTYRRYDSTGRVTMRALPSAISDYDDTYADLLRNQSGNYEFLRDSLGLIQTASYYTSTTATSTTAGSKTGYRNQTGIQRGETGTSILQSTRDYISRTASPITIYPLANTTRYRNTNGTGGQSTNFAFGWFSGTIQPESVTVTLPTVTTAQNGSNSANAMTMFADERGRTIWSKDEGGFINHYAYDDVTGGMTKSIVDVDTSQTSTFTNLPSGWSTPSGGGLHLTATYEIDTLGRTTKATDANGNITYIVYDDLTLESRVYAGWNTSTNAPTGPTIVQREDRARGYRETLTMSATPSLTSSKPNGTESISSIQSLSREVLNDAGQTVYVDQYFDLSGVTYSQTTATLGTSGTNYNRTQQDYDKLGLPNRTLTPTGTIYRTFRDAALSWIF